MTVRILIVDDETALVDNLAGFLSLFPEEFNISTASSGEEALSLLDHVQPDVLLTDLRMPGIDGLELARLGLLKKPGMGTVLMTAYGNTEFCRQISNQHLLHVISKPLDLMELRMILHDASARATTGDALREAVELADVVQLARSGNKTGTLRIRGAGGIGTLIFCDGVMVDAQTGDLRGAEAFLHMSSWKNASFEEIPQVSGRGSASERNDDNLLMVWEDKPIDTTMHLLPTQSSAPMGVKEGVWSMLVGLLDGLSEVPAFIAAGVYTLTGEPIATAGDGEDDLAAVSGLIAVLMRTADRSTRELGLGNAVELDVTTSEGRKIFLRCHANTKAAFVLALSCAWETSNEKASSHLDRTLPLVALVLSQ